MTEVTHRKTQLRLSPNKAQTEKEILITIRVELRFFRKQDRTATPTGQNHPLGLRFLFLTICFVWQKHYTINGLFCQDVKEIDNKKSAPHKRTHWKTRSLIVATQFSTNTGGNSFFHQAEIAFLPFYYWWKKWISYENPLQNAKSNLLKTLLYTIVWHIHYSIKSALCQPLSSTVFLQFCYGFFQYV